MSFSQIWLIPLVDDHYSKPSPPTWQNWKEKKNPPFISGRVILWKFNSIEKEGGGGNIIDKQIKF
jgi:hypothetical protein